MLSAKDEPTDVIASHVMSTTPVEKEAACYTIITSDVGDDEYGAFLAFFESEQLLSLELTLFMSFLLLAGKKDQ